MPSVRTAPAAGTVQRRSNMRAVDENRPHSLRSVGLAIAASLTILAVALGVVLSRSPLTVAATNGVAPKLAARYLDGNESSCQSGGTLPAGTEAIRLSLSANTGPKVGVRVFSGQTLVTQGEHEAGWGIDETVTVPVKRVAHAIPAARVCMAIGPVAEPLQANGERLRKGPGRFGALLRIEYLRPGAHSWLSLVSSTARHMGLDHAPSGAWVAYLAIAAMILVAALAARLVLLEVGTVGRTVRKLGIRERLLGRLGPVGRALARVPPAALTCALIATISAACWSAITPPFQAPDEPSHFAYAQLLAESGRLPTSNSGAVSQEEETVVRALDQGGVEWHPEVQTISSPTAVRGLREDLALPLNRVGPGGAGVAAAEPPLYYALEAIPYLLGSSGNLLDRLELMRLLSALIGGLTALFVFLFVRESLPGTPWAWTVGGLGAALSPLLGFTSGAVTPDGLLFAVSAAIFYCLARAFRRGLTRKLAVAIGVLTAAGFLTKLNFIGLAPGVMLALVVLGLRGVGSGSSEASSTRAFGSMAIAMAIALSPVCVYVASNLLEHHHTLGLVTSAAHQTSGRESILGEVSYIWQFYLPRLPGMASSFPGLSTIRQLWFNRAVGLYGWLDTTFPQWVYNLALIPAGLIAILALRSLLASRAALRARLPELLVYLIVGVGLMALIGADSHAHQAAEGAGYAQPRYLMPMLALAAAVLALAARGAGKRLGPAVGASIVVLFLAQDVFSQLLVVARFYG